MICLLDGDVKDDDLFNILVKKLPKGVKLRVMFDCCHSGSGLDLPYRLREYSYGFDSEHAGIHVDDKDIIMISGCRDEQTSADAWIATARENEGAMTWAWLQTLEWIHKYMPNANWVDVLYKMRFYLLEGEYDQVPQLSSSNKKNVYHLTEFS